MKTVIFISYQFNINCANHDRVTIQPRVKLLEAVRMCNCALLLITLHVVVRLLMVTSIKCRSKTLLLMRETVFQILLWQPHQSTIFKNRLRSLDYNKFLTIS